MSPERKRISVGIDVADYEFLERFMLGYPRMKNWLLRMLVAYAVRHFDEAWSEMCEMAEIRLKARKFRERTAHLRVIE